jgi:predicted ATPase
MLVRRAYVPEGLRPESLTSWPYTVPCVGELAEHGLDFTAPITFLVGENGSGKSTLVEAIAEAFKLDAHGGRAGRKYSNDRPKTPSATFFGWRPPPPGPGCCPGPAPNAKASSYAPRPRSD